MIIVKVGTKEEVVNSPMGSFVHNVPDFGTIHFGPGGITSWGQVKERDANGVITIWVECADEKKTELILNSKKLIGEIDAKRSDKDMIKRCRDFIK